MDSPVIKVKLHRNDDGFGFSLLKAAGFSHTHIIYDISENSAAAESGKVICNLSNLLLNPLKSQKYGKRL